MTGDFASHQCGFFNRQECIPAVTDQLSITAHGNQAPPQSFDTFLGGLP